MGHRLPAPVDWVPLLVMSLTVGLFEAVLFRGFVQGRLEASFGIGPSVAGAAALYGLYHLGYGMRAGDLAFLFVLGVVYAIAYQLCQNLLVLWPLLTPLGPGSHLEAGDVELPWASITGFADVLAVMAVVIWLAHRHRRWRPRVRRRRLPRRIVTQAWRLPELEEQLLQLGLAVSGPLGGLLVAQAVTQAAGEDLEAGLVERAGGR